MVTGTPAGPVKKERVEGHQDIVAGEYRSTWRGDWRLCQQKATIKQTKNVAGMVSSSLPYAHPGHAFMEPVSTATGDISIGAVRTPISAIYTPGSDDGMRWGTPPAFSEGLLGRDASS